MSKRMFTYKLVSPEGYEVDYSTFEESATALKDKHFEEIMFWEKDGWSVKKVSNVVPVVSVASQPTTTPQTPPTCGIHNIPMTWKVGVSKTSGKSYAFWACSGKMPDGSWCTYKPPK